MAQADVLRYEPGRRVDVEAVADSGGHAPQRGDLVQVAGENAGHTEVELVQGSDGKAVAILTGTPPDFDSADNGSYSDNASVGVIGAYLVKPVINVVPTSGYSPTAGDVVQATAGSNRGRVEESTGLTTAGQDGTVTNNVGVDGNGNLENASASDIDVAIRQALPLGEVFSTVAREFNQGDAIGVALWR